MQIAKALGGFISVESTANHGSKFTLHLPYEVLNYEKLGACNIPDYKILGLNDDSNMNVEVKESPLRVKYLTKELYDVLEEHSHV